MSEWVVVVAGSGVIVWLLWRRHVEVQRIARGDFEGAAVDDILHVLWNEYVQGHVEPEWLARLPKGKPGLNGQNQLVCLEVAAGRYQEALAWRDRKPGVIAEHERLITLNLAEALACLGRLEESLALTSFGAEVQTDFLKAGLAAHRAWVLAELGRFAEARAELTAMEGKQRLLGPFEAEWYFSSFAVALAAKDWALAERELERAARVAVRGSTKRNLHFLRGRLDFARGDLEAACRHFEAGAAHAYRWQGGPSLLEWGEALERLGRVSEARTAWQWCVERDPQSPAAKMARVRLG
ncbi:MAG: tetratricopeptide repeat protein [Myxococcota bacterium]